jgi:hypothetical protein
VGPQNPPPDGFCPPGQMAVWTGVEWGCVAAH